MKVAVIIDTWFPFVGGGQINAWEISKRLAKRGVKIDIITRNNGKDSLKRVKNLHVYKLGSKTNPNNTLSKLIFVFRAFVFTYRRNYDLIHAHAFLPGITARFQMVFKATPVVFTVHGTSIDTKLNNIFSRWIEKFILTGILYNAQITVSQDFSKLQNVNKRVIYIPNGVDLKKFDKLKAKKFANPTLIFVGRLHPQKNLKTLISAIVIVKEKIPNVRLLIVGDGEQKKELQRLARNLKLKANIRFLGTKTRSDLVELYESCHAFILPSIYEGQPVTLLEAWAAKLPVVVTQRGDCQFLVKNGFNGYLINDPKNPQVIANMIIRAFKNKNLDELGENGYNLVKDNFSWEKSAQQTMEVYTSVI